jgi:integrase
LEAEIAARANGRTLPNERLTVAGYLTCWLQEQAALGRLRATTRKNYESYVRLHLIPGVGDLSLAKLTPRQVQDFIIDRLAKGCSPRTVSYLRGLLRTALEQALRQRLVTENVAKLVQVPQVTTTEVVPFSEEEAKAFVTGIHGDDWEALYLLVLMTGLRQGEALGLRWQDIDFESKEIHIRNQLQRPDRKFQLVPPKTEKSKDKIPLPPMAGTAVLAHRDRQRLKRTRAEKAGETWGNEWDLVFTRDLGEPLHGGVVTHTFQKRLKELGLPHKRFHDLRHSYASLLATQGHDLFAIKEMLRHSEVSLTANLYAHMLKSRRQEIAAGIDSFFSAPSDVGRPDLLGEQVSDGDSQGTRYRNGCCPS